VAAGAMMVELTRAPVRVRSAETLGAGGDDARIETRCEGVWSDCTVGAGATMAVFRAGAERELLEETLGAGGTMELLRVRLARD